MPKVRTVWISVLSGNALVRDASIQLRFASTRALPPLRAPDPLGDAVRVGEEEARGVHHERAVGLALDREGRDDRRREGLGRRACRRLAGADRAHALVVTRDEDALAAPLEADDRAAARLASIETQRPIAPAGREDALVHEVLVQAGRRDLQEDLVAVGVDAHADERRLLRGERSGSEPAERANGADGADEGHREGPEEGSDGAAALRARRTGRCGRRLTGRCRRGARTAPASSEPAVTPRRPPVGTPGPRNGPGPGVRDAGAGLERESCDRYGTSSGQ